MAVVLQVRDIIRKRCGDKQIPIIPEIAEAMTGDICDSIDIADYVSSEELHAQVLSTVSHEPRLSDVLHKLISETGDSEFAVEPLEVYLPEGQPTLENITFFEIM